MSRYEPAADARLALRLFAADPAKFGGIVLRGAGPQRDRLIEELRDLMPANAPLLRLPLHSDDDALLGGLDLAASLAAGCSVQRAGLLDRAKGGALIVPMAERIEPHLAGRLAQMLDDPAQRCGLVLLDDSVCDEPGPPASLTERVAFVVDTTIDAGTAVRSDNPVSEMPLEDAKLLASVADEMGVAGIRPLLHAAATARAHASHDGRNAPNEADLIVAARLVLSPRATRLPQPSDAVPPAEQPDNGSQHDKVAGSTESIEDVVLAAALSALPPDLLRRLAEGRSPRRSRASTGGGKRARSGLRGRPLAARPGMPRGGVRLALVDTLRAAVPWQKLRQADCAPTSASTLRIHVSDLRIRRFTERTRAVTIIAVDASGSAAAARLAEAKGAVERLLAQAYVTRSEVALIAFRGTGADLLLPPTRSLTRARRALSELPGGGGTPLAAAIASAQRLADVVAAHGATPLLVFLTDGSANIAADGSAGRARATEDALSAARVFAASGHNAMVIDIAPRPRPDARALAEAMQARLLPLPLADSATIARAVAAG